jgi:hypothetical protein
MKQILTFFLPIIMISATLSAQYLVDPNKPYKYLNTTPGYTMINEITYGFPRGDGVSHYNGNCFGFTTIHGYQMDRYFMAGGGAGASFFENGTQVTLFMHIRFSLLMRALTPVLYSDGGFMFGTESQPVLYVNPGIGVRYSMNRKLGITLGMGINLFSDPKMQSLANFRLGLTYKPAGAGKKRARR